VRARTNQGHVAFQDVPQLWQFVQTVFAKKPAKASDTRIIGDLKEWAAALVEPTQVFFQPSEPAIIVRNLKQSNSRPNLPKRSER